MPGYGSSVKHVCSQVTTYGFLLGMAVQSVQWEQSMNRHLVEMTLSMSQATEQQSVAAKNQEAATMHEADADQDLAEANALEDAAEVQMEESKADALKATESEVAAEEEEAAAETATEDATEHVAQAAIEERAKDVAEADAVADSAVAAETETAADADEMAIAVCQAVPLLDLVCDVVGGTSVIGLQIAAATETADAVVAAAAAAAAQGQEDTQVSLAAEASAAAAEESAAAAASQEQVAEWSERAVEKQEEAEEEQAAADELTDKAETEQEEATEEETAAAAEEAEADRLTQKAIREGGQACWDSMMAGVTALLQVIVLVLRSITNYVFPAATAAVQWLWQSTSAAGRVEAQSTYLGESLFVKLARHVSYLGHHVAILVFSMSLFGNTLAHLNAMSLRGRGGILIALASATAVIQAGVLHTSSQVIHACLHRTETSAWTSVTHILWDLVSRWIAFSILILMEVLILWIDFGHMPAFTESFLAGVRWWMWFILLMTSFAHVWFLELRMGTVLKGQNSSESYNGASVQESHLYESMPLVRGFKDDSLAQETDSDSGESETLITVVCGSPEAACYDSILYDATGYCESDVNVVSFGKVDIAAMPRFGPSAFGVILLGTFELLLASCMISLIRNCFPYLLRLWLVAKPILMAVQPAWLYPFCLVGMSLLTTVAMIGASIQLRKTFGAVAPQVEASSSVIDDRLFLNDLLFMEGFESASTHDTKGTTANQGFIVTDVSENTKLNKSFHIPICLPASLA